MNNTNPTNFIWSAEIIIPGATYVLLFLKKTNEKITENISLDLANSQN